MLKLLQAGYGEFDLVFDEDAGADDVTALSTIIYALLFTDAEAGGDLQPDIYQRRGWWYDSAVGSLIWALRQQPLNADTRSAAISNVTDVLASHPELSAVSVTDISADRSVSALTLSISAAYNGITSIVQVEL
jgi:phage gp46-like protein